MSDLSPVLVWFRHDLRLADNPALHAAAATGRPVILLYVLEETAEQRPLGGASRWWLDKSLRALAGDIAARGGQLTLRRGDAREVVPAVVAETCADAVYWNRRYDKPGRDIDSAIKSHLRSDGCEAGSFNGSLLTEPWTIRTGAGQFYKVFTPYWKAVRATYQAPPPLPAPERLDGPPLPGDALDDWGLHPTSPDWSTGFAPVWTPGEAGARERLDAFLNGPVRDYVEQRNMPGNVRGTSGLSPHLRWGEISPVQVWRAVHDRLLDHGPAEGPAAGEGGDAGATTFLSEIVWREFSYVLLYHMPDLAEANYNDDFRHMPWHEDARAHARWCRGRTGYPMVDAGMRQLWQTGWMHNRVRMLTGSFLTKHLLLPWQWGEQWFWDTLVDADPASNAASWQWVAGSGADAAPYFRIFNPISQGTKFDPDGSYVRRWCPELAGLPDKYLHAPWTAPDPVLEKAGVTLGESWPHPIIEHGFARQRALDAYATLKQKRDAA